MGRPPLGLRTVRMRSDGGIPGRHGVGLWPIHRSLRRKKSAADGPAPCIAVRFRCRPCVGPPLQASHIRVTPRFIRTSAPVGRIAAGDASRHLPEPLPPGHPTGTARLPGRRHQAAHGADLRRGGPLGPGPPPAGRHPRDPRTADLHPSGTSDADHARTGLRRPARRRASESRHCTSTAVRWWAPMPPTAGLPDRDPGHPRRWHRGRSPHRPVLRGALRGLRGGLPRGPRAMREGHAWSGRPREPTQTPRPRRSRQGPPRPADPLRNNRRRHTREIPSGATCRGWCTDVPVPDGDREPPPPCRGQSPPPLQRTVPRNTTRHSANSPLAVPTGTGSSMPEGLSPPGPPQRRARRTWGRRPPGRRVRVLQGSASRGSPRGRRRPAGSGSDARAPSSTERTGTASP